MMKNALGIAFLIFMLPLTGNAQAESIFNGIHLGESLEIVTKKVNGIAKNPRLIFIDKPNFPLAKTTEEHLVYSEVKTENGTIGSAVFTFADDKLVYIEARGNAIEVLTSKRTDTATAYMDYEVYRKGQLFVNKKKNAIWIMTEEATHTNLFTWNNPYLDAKYEANIASNNSNKIPEFLKMGASFEELKDSFEANSSFTNREELDGSDPNAQFQVNCFGVNYLGFPRKIEARFGDNKLNVVWILTGKGEEDRVRAALIHQYGNPIFTNDDWEIFDNWQVGLRKDKPEVALLEKQIGLAYKTNYFKQ